MDHIKTPWNQPFDLPPEYREMQNRMEEVVEKLKDECFGSGKRDHELTDFQACVKAGVPLKMNVVDGKVIVETAKRCTVFRDNNGIVLHVYVLEQS